MAERRVDLLSSRALRPVATKIVPPTCGPGTVRRDAIESVLGVGARVTALVGPAGFGKTTAVARWASYQSVPVAWYTADHFDARPSVFWRYLSAAIERVSPRWPTGKEAVHDAFTLLDALGPDPDPCVVVLDDAHLVDSGAVLEQLAYLIERAPAPLRFVIISRARPHLPLARWAAKGLLAEVPEHLWPMDEREAAALVRAGSDTEVSDSVVESLCEAVGGWAAVLRLVGRMLGRTAPSAARPLSRDRMVFDYVLGEALAALSDEEREAALLLSLLDEIDPRRCELLCGVADGRLVLGALQRNGTPMISLDPAVDAWRFHALVREVLGAELRRTHGAGIAALNVRAAEVELAVGNPPAAVRHLLAAGDLDRAFRIVFAPLSEMYRTGAMQEMADWIDLFPAEFIAASAERSSTFALAMGYLGRRHEFELWVGQTDAHRVETSSDVDIATTVLRLLDALDRGETDLVREEVTSLRVRVGADVLHRTRECPVFPASAVAALADERLDDAAYWVKSMVRWPDMPEQVRLVAQPARAAWEAYLRGSLARSAELARGALECGGEAGRAALHVRIELYTVLAALALERLDLVEAERWVARAGELIATMHPCLHRCIADRVAFAVVEAREGPAAAAAAAAAAADPAPPAVASRYLLMAAEFEARAGHLAMADRRWAALPPSPRRSIVAARIAAQTGCTETVEAELRALPPAVELPRSVRIEAELIRTLVNPGSVALDRALELGVEDGYAWTYRREGPALVAMLRGSVRAGGRWSGTELARSFQVPVNPPDVPVVRFTDVELRVLGFLPSHRPLAEIAGEMFVSVNTVKTHVGNIYRKLGVGMRSDAVRRAAEMGLLGPN